MSPRIIAAVIVAAVALAAVGMVGKHLLAPRWEQVPGDVRLPDQPAECEARRLPNETAEHHVARCGVR